MPENAHIWTKHPAVYDISDDASSADDAASSTDEAAHSGQWYDKHWDMTDPRLRQAHIKRQDTYEQRSDEMREIEPVSSTPAQPRHVKRFQRRR